MVQKIIGPQISQMGTDERQDFVFLFYQQRLLPKDNSLFRPHSPHEKNHFPSLKPSMPIRAICGKKIIRPPIPLTAPETK
jgi:hypothetical protein